MKPAEEILLKDALKALKLSTMQSELSECARQSKVSGDTYEAFLLSLCERELQHRRANQLTRRLKEAGFPQMKVLEETQTEKWQSLKPMQIRSYAEGGYIQNRENLIFIGKHGTGKTHAAVAFGYSTYQASPAVFCKTDAHSCVLRPKWLNLYRCYWLEIIPLIIC